MMSGRFLWSGVEVGKVGQRGCTGGSSSSSKKRLLRRSRGGGRTIGAKPRRGLLA